jgi:hypothetical protein
MSDDNPLAGIDLGLARAPHAPDRFTHGVMIRFEAVEAAVASARHRRRRQLAWVASSVAAVAAIVVSLVALWPRTTVTIGSYATDTPHHLVIDDVTAEMASGAAVSWRIDGDRVVVDQHGEVTWTVPAGKRLRVEAAGVGSVDAENATLHVEARMNLMDKKGVTVATALAVTAIAVTVMHGNATVHGTALTPGTTTTIAATGATTGATTDATLVKNVPPVQLEPLRIAGEKSIMPDDQTKTELQVAGTHRLVGAFKLCLDRAGGVSSVSVLKTTGAPRYDDKILTKMGEWRYKPFVDAGVAVPVCTAVTFIYEQ